MEFVPWIVQLASGAGGGTLAGKTFAHADEGPWINIAIGVLGGVACAQILGAVVGLASPDAGAVDISVILSSVIGGIVGGGALLYGVGKVGKQPIGKR